MSNTITAQEIKEIRAMYGLTQRSFALLLGIGPASMVRYEQGSQPSKANANLIRAARHPSFMRECLERDGHLLPKRQSEHASRIVYAAISLDPAQEEDAMETVTAKNPATATAAAKAPRTMDEVYHYTIQQEVLNEQAANIACDLMEYLIERNVDLGDGSHPVSILLSQLLRLKRSLVTDEADDEATLEQIRGYLRYLEEFAQSLRFAEGVA